MNEDALILTVRIVAILIVVLIVGLIAFGMWRNRQRELLDSGDPRARRSALDAKTPLDPDSNDDFLNGNVEVRQQTAQLNPSFFGDDSAGTVPAQRKSTKQASKQKSTPRSVNEAPSSVLPYTIMARFGRHLTGKDVANLVRTFGLQRAPSGAYELIGADGEEVMFTMLNVRKPGIFPDDLNQLDKIEGLMLIMQLPVGDDAVESWETFTAMAHEMTEAVDARLCDHARRPIGDADLLKYRQAAEQFEQEYQAWRSKQ
ncbi:cell division protein ZipA C-terminal FtsZ-binding domain-containing protein [Cardiobacteriaceae bacterium TAE3-ERU3]|nr:cell division protein ZipA C-terminal FtsZ-binding domain-containing protein [Cardiobacteriaceae bacterium TAE3-ERU3]